MRNLILMGLFGSMAFAASAAGSWFLKSKMETLETKAEDATAAASPMDKETAPLVKLGLHPPEGDLPVAVRSRPMSVEEILRFGTGLKSREKLLNGREKSLEQEESRLKLALADIRGEQQQVEGLQAKLEGQTETCQALLLEIQQAHAALLTEREDAEKELNDFQEVRVETNEQELQNIKKMSEWFQSMEPEKAAGAIKELANEGKTDIAVKLLANFEERDAAKILSALDDYALMVELAERFKDMKRPEKRDTRRR